jgi:1-acyl-sn-glycerol-3-phosphate acyltransferase
VLYDLLKLVTRMVFRLFFGLRAIGADNVPREGAVLLASNHVSLLDPPAVGSGVARRLHYMAKAELFRVPLLGALIRRLNAYPVEREGADAAALRHALLLLREGQGLLVFPEGTRGTEGQLQRGRAGAGMLAALSEAPVVPVYVQGTGQVWPRGANRPRRGRVTVRYGPPLRFQRGRGKNRYQEICDEIMAAIGRLKAEADLASTPAPGGPAVNPNAERTARGPLPVGQQH